MAHIEESIFRAYDIRGREGNKELNERTLELLGKAYGTYLARKNVDTVVVGHDSRSTSGAFSQAAISGLVSCGLSVIDIGTCLTPMSYWAQFYFKTEGSMMITASHNPVGWNGAKFASGMAQTLGGDALKTLYEMISSDDFEEREGGDVERQDITGAYFKDITSRINIKAGRTVVVSTGNGTMGLFAPQLLKRVGCEVVELNTTVDPTYPHYTPNPATTEMMEDTGRTVREHRADFGLAFDGDGDRVGLSDEHGETVNPDRFFIFLVRLLFKEKPGATVVFDATSTQAIAEETTKLGGTAIIAPTGHTKIKAKMEEVGADIAGEASGHMFFSHGYYGFDDGLFAALKLVEFFSSQDVRVSELVRSLPSYVASPRWYAYTPDDKKFDIVAKLVGEFKAEGNAVEDIDGARVIFDGGWGIVRASNTSPALVLRFEATGEERLKEIEQLFRDKLSQFPEVGTEWKAG